MEWNETLQVEEAWLADDSRLWGPEVNIEPKIIRISSADCRWNSATFENVYSRGIKVVVDALCLLLYCFKPGSGDRSRSSD